jgi:transposase-like protein
MAYTVRSPKEKLRIVIEGMKAENISALCRQEGISPTDYYRYREKLIGGLVNSKCCGNMSSIK